MHPTVPLSADILATLRTGLSGRYEIEGEIGHGGMATVLLGRDLRHGRAVAIKVLHPELATSLGSERFLREIQTTARFLHPHILPVYDSGNCAALLYYIMPFVRGESLRHRLERERRLPLDTALALTRQIAGALDYAHAQGIAHRDIKPENILLLDDAHAVVADFGLALALFSASNQPLTASGYAVGSPVYMSPEQAAGEHGDARSDIYSLGCMFFEMLAGEPPFHGKSTHAILNRHLTEVPPTLRSRGVLVPDAVEAAVARCMAKLPTERFARACDFVDALVAAPTATGTVAPTRPRTAPHSAEVYDTRAHKLREFVQRWSVVFVGSVLALALGVFVWRTTHATTSVQEPAATPTTTQRTMVAVLPFDVHGPNEMAYLGRGMVELLSTSLDGAGNLRTVDPPSVFALMRKSADSARSPTDLGAAVAENLAAQLFVTGEIVPQKDGYLHISAYLYDRSSGNQPPVRATAAGNDISALVDTIATQLLVGRSGASQRPMVQIAAATTQKLPALKAYLEGEEELRRARYESSVTAFRRAVTEDPSFALAHYRLSAAAEWNFDFQRAGSAAKAAKKHQQRLPERFWNLLQAWTFFLDGAATRAEQEYSNVLTTYQDDIEARAGMGEVLAHYNPVRGRSATEAEPWFARTLELAPDYGEARFHMLEFAAMRRDSIRFDQLLAGVNPASNQLLAWRTVRAYAWGAAAERARMKAQLARANEFIIGIAIARIAGHLHDLAGAVDLSELLIAPDRSKDWRAAGHVLRAELLVAQGKLRSARAELELARQTEPSYAAEMSALFTVFPLHEPSPGELQAARTATAQWDPTSVRSSPAIFFGAHFKVHAHLRLYMLALLSARAADYPAAERYVHELEQLDRGTTSGEFARSLSSSARGHAAAWRGQDENALAHFKHAAFETPLEMIMLSPIYSQALDRFQTAEVLARTAQPETALSWYEGLTQGFDFFFVAPSLLRMAQINDRMGRAALAASQYGRFITLWQNADPELQPYVNQARARVAALK